MHKKYLKGIQYAVLATVACASMPALSCPEYRTTYMGTICYTAATFCPRGYTEANGNLLDINSHQALFSLLGTQYGGDGRTTFALPNLVDRALVGAGKGENLTPRVLGQKFGQKSITLTTNQLPYHAWSTFINLTVTIPSRVIQVPVSTQPGDTVVPQGDVYLAGRQDGALMYTPSTGESTAKIPINIPTRSVTVSGESASVGNGEPIAITQPSLTLTACIAHTYGSRYPRRN